MTRVGRGIERLDLTTYEALIGGLGDTPEDVGINLKTWYFAPRLGRDVPLRREGGRARRLRAHDQPAAVVATDARLVPAGHLLQPDRRSVRVRSARSRQGIPPVPIPDISSGRVHAAAGRVHAFAEPERRRSRHHPAVERRLRVPAAVGHRGRGGLRRHAHRWRLRRSQPELRRSRAAATPSRQYFALAGTTAVDDWAARTKSRYHGLQISVNRPFKNDLLLKGGLHATAESKNMTRNDEDGWTDLDLEPPADVRPQLRDGRLRPPARVPDGLRLGAAVPAGVAPTWSARLLQGWQLNGIVAAYSGTPFSVAGTNTALNCQGCGNGDFITINVHRRSEADRRGRAQRPSRTITLDDLLAADRRRRRRLRQQRPQPLPSSGCLERRSVAVQGVPDRPVAAGVPARGGQRVQPHELGPPGGDVHRQQLHAVRAAEHRSSPTPTTR